MSGTQSNSAKVASHAVAITRSERIPAVIGLTNLGIRGVAPGIIEAAHAFGASPRQVPLTARVRAGTGKAELPE